MSLLTLLICSLEHLSSRSRKPISLARPIALAFACACFVAFAFGICFDLSLAVPFVFHLRVAVGVHFVRRRSTVAQPLQLCLARAGIIQPKYQSLSQRRGRCRASVHTGPRRRADLPQ